MKTRSKRIAIAIVILVLIILVFVPKPVYFEFEEPKQFSQIKEMFQYVSITNIKYDVVGTNYTSGGYVENLDEIEINEIESEEKIKSIECNISGIDLINIMLHKNDYNIDKIYVFQIMLGRIEDAIEKLVYR